MNTRELGLSSIFNSLPKAMKDAALIQGAIAAAIINKRYDLGLTQKEFAKKYHVSQSMVSKWESADYNFTISNLVELMDTLQIPFNVLVDEEPAILEKTEEYKEIEAIHPGWDAITLDFFSTTTSSTITKGAA